MSKPRSEPYISMYVRGHDKHSDMHYYLLPRRSYLYVKDGQLLHRGWEKGASINLEGVLCLSLTRST